MRFKDTDFLTKGSVLLGGRLCSLQNPLVMGIINCTEDSFYSGSRASTAAVAVEQAQRHLDEGADILDIGAVSTRPGAAGVAAATELKRLDKALTAIRKKHPSVPVSIDTFRSGIVRKLYQHHGVEMVNDVSGGAFDPGMFETVADLSLPYVLMHMQGTPATMQKEPSYNDVVHDVIKWLAEKIFRLEQLGVRDILPDPGFGFGKTVQHNYQMLQRLEEFHILQHPLVVGLSRKSMIWKLLHRTPEEALNATTAAHTIALMKGARLLRVHDVQEAREAIRVINACAGNL